MVKRTIERSLRAFATTLLLAAAAYAAGGQFMTSDGKLSLEIPPELETIAVDSPQVEIALRARTDGPTGGAGFPTFNLISAAGRYDPDRAVEVLEEEVSKGYRGVGLTDARIVHSGVESMNGVRVFRAELTYVGTGGAPFVASVRMIPAGDGHFIATFMDRAEGYRVSSEIERRIAESMSIERSAEIPGTDGTEKPIGWPRMAGAAIAFLTLFLALRHRLRR